MSRASKPDAWSSPRAYTDAGLRMHHYGPLEPMHDRRAQFRSDLWLLLLVPAIGVAVVLAVVAVS